MRICMLVSSDLWRDPRVQKEAMSTVQAGNEVIVLCRTVSQPLSVPYQIVPLNIRHHLGGHSLVKIGERLLFISKLLFKTITFKPDLIHANDLDTLPAAYLAAQFCRAKVVYDAHEFWGSEEWEVPPLVTRFARHTEGFLMRRIAHTVTVSNVIASKMSSLYGVKTPDLILNAPPYESYSAEYLGQLRSARRQNAQSVVLYQGVYVKHRGLEEAIDSAAHFPPNVVLMLRGFGPLEDEIRATVMQQKLQDKVVLTPPVPAADTVKAALDADIGLVLVKPVSINHLGSAPNKLFQYIMAGLPIIANGSLFAKELIETYGIGRFIETLTPQTLADTIVEMLADPEALKLMSQRCLELAKELCWERQGEKLVGIYAQVTNHRNGNH